MLQIPPNYFVSMQLVPVFEWERVDQADDAPAPAPAAGAGPTPAAESFVAPPPSPDPPSADLRLVFKGYEWRPISERTVFSRADWESVYCSEADVREEERDPHRNESARRQTVPPPKAAHDPFADLQAHPGADRTDTSEP
ncbi:MAG: hypothetical protein U1E90_14970 [Burkholderiaceae bacterium]